MPKKKDFILIGVLLVIALIGLGVTQFLQHQTGASVTITIGGEIYGTYPLDQSRKATTKWSLRMAASTWRMPIVRINTVSNTQPFMPAMKRSSVCLMSWWLRLPAAKYLTSM